MEPETSRTPCFIAEEECLDTHGDVEAGISGNNENHPHHSIIPIRSDSFRNMCNSRFSSSRSARFYDGRYEDNNPHFLESCFLCQKPLGNNRDIFMYRGDTPFCSEECRDEQIERDENKEKKWNLSSSMKALRKKERRESTSPTKSEEHPLRTSTIAAA